MEESRAPRSLPGAGGWGAAGAAAAGGGGAAGGGVAVGEDSHNASHMSYWSGHMS